MVKTFFNYQGVDYPVREVYVEDIDGFTGNVKVCDVDVYLAYEHDYEMGDRRVNNFDNSIFYFCDFGFIASDPTDEEIVNYLKANVD